jgi:hypothetical protein
MFMEFETRQGLRQTEAFRLGFALVEAANS